MSDPDPLRLARHIARQYRSESRAPVRKRKPVAEERSQNPHRDDLDDPVPVGNVVNDLVTRLGWGEHLAAARVYSQWPKIVGPDVAKHCTLEHLDDGVAHVSTTSTAWAKEIKLLAPRIIAKLNDALGDGKVLTLDVRGPAAPSWKKGPRSVKWRGPRDTYG